MRLKSPTNQPISFGTANGSGHSMVLGPDGADVPQMFIQSLSVQEPSRLTLMLRSLFLLQKASQESLTWI
jgi:hypothetical protein